VLVSLLGATAFAAEPPVVFSEKPICYDHGNVNNDNVLTAQDAIYVLYNYLLPEDNPIVHQSADFNGDNRIDSKDAIYLLYAANFDSGDGLGDKENNRYLNGSVHEYYTPYFIWTAEPGDPTAVTAKLVIRCGCGDVQQTVAATVSEPAVTAATCTTAGRMEFHATASYTFQAAVNGEVQSFTFTYTTDKNTTEGYTVVNEPYSLVIPATGHAIGEPTCAADAVCANNCGYTIPKLDTHNWDEGTEIRAATCTQGSAQLFTCGTCGTTKTVELDDKVPHDYQYVEGADHLVTGSACKWARTYKCNTDGCNATTEGGYYEVHTFAPGAVTEATCTVNGSQLFVCSAEGCGATKEETIAKNPDAHSWTAGESVDGITTHTCTHCGATKTTVAATNGSEVDKGTLTANELTLNDAEGNALASIDLGTEALSGAAEDAKIAITVEQADKTAINVSEEALQQIGDNIIYDFTLTVDSVDTSSFGGEITISLPYTLQDGDDVDAIDVWFIDDEGNLDVVQGKYANGMVVFTTDHFSYYTVTRLTPAQRCSVYGHVQTEYTQAATCTAAGYTKYVCGRCGIDIPDTEIIPIAALDHDFQESTNGRAATCTEYGYTQYHCSRCGHIRQENIMPLGHDMQKNDAECQDATCIATGKVVFTCANGCGFSTTTVIQLAEHTYGKAQVHYPTCTEGGYTSEICTVTGCGHERISDKRDPLGHDYSADTWTWSEDLSSASLLIVCKNDHSHDQVIKANVTKQTEAASCTSSGFVTHTASLYFNNKLYEDKKSSELEKNAHQPAGDWVTTGTQHHRLCQVCGQKVDVADHNWDNGTVTTAATCIENGSKTYTCQVCGHTKTETVLATGIHDLVDGTCSVCGFSENTCKHDRFYRQRIDTSSYGICPIELYLISCDCGQKQYATYMSSSCEWGDGTVVSKVISDGTTQNVYVNTCSVCGLVEESFYHNEYKDEDSCTGYFKNYEKLSIKGTTIVETLYRSGETSVHPFVSHTKSTDLADLGICGGTLYTSTCACGELTSTYVDGEVCLWSYDENGNQTCTVCGVTRSSDTVTEKTEGCRAYYRSDITYTLNGKVVLTCTERYIGQDHDSYVADYTLNSTACDDGVTLHYMCRKCDFEDYVHTDFHAREVVTTTDLSGYGSCDTELVVGSCACGQYASYYLDGSHNWAQVSEDEKTQTAVFTCSECGYTRTDVTTDGEKDENCGYYKTTVSTYTDGKGHTYSTRTDRWITGHEYEIRRELTGKTCLEGVTISQVCTRCGYVYDKAYQEGVHVMVSSTEYDMSQFGACEGTSTVYSCVCGQQTSHSTDSSCNWQIDFENFSDVYQKSECAVCGITRVYTNERLATIDDCHDRVRITFTYSKDGKETGKVSYTTVMDTHRTVNQCTLKNADLGCAGGYTINVSCLDCDYTHSMDSTALGYDEYGCEMTWVVSRQIVSVNQLCGDLELAKMSCACGNMSSTYDIWTNGSCNFQFNSYDYDYETQTESHIDVCTKCGAIREESYNWTPIEGETCRQHVAGHVKVIAKSGQIACDYDWNSYGYAHNPENTYELLDPEAGCDGGYRTYGTCLDCGAVTDDGSWIQYGCMSQLIRETVILEHEDICGSVYLHETSCACGREHYAYTSYDCTNTTWTWDGIENRGVVTCLDCGLIQYSSGNTQPIKGTCTATQNFDETYVLNDETIATYQDSVVVSYHNDLASYQMNGQSCEDGYTVSFTCAECGRFRSEDSEYRHHEERLIAYYDFSDYGLCGGEYMVWSCGCGKNSSRGWNHDCNWTYTGQQDENGYGIEYCADCNTYMYSGEVGTHDVPNCSFVGTSYVKLIRNDELLLEVNMPISGERHTMQVSGTSLHDPHGDCLDGVTVSERCIYCGHSDTYIFGDHICFQTYRLDLSSGCGGQLTFGKCACGKEYYFSREMKCQNMSRVQRTVTDDEGIIHNYTESVCADCGLSIRDDSYTTTDKATCLITHHEVSTVTYNGETYVFDNQSKEYDHDYEYTAAELVDPTGDCLQGVNVTWSCRVCGVSGSYENYKDHALVLTDTIDLAEYGAVCGAGLGHYKCACGARERYDFTGDTLCDVDWQRMEQTALEAWIPGVINNEQWTTEDYYRTYSNGYLLVCAVTDDANGSNPCGLKIRAAEYYLNENCTAVEYQIWQLGYDETDGSCDKEIVIKTGEQHTYHNYEYSNNRITQSDGSYVDEDWNLCSDCKSYELYRNTYDASGVQTKHEWIRENALGNGETQNITLTSIYDLTYGDYRYESTATTEYIYADGSTFWEKNTYSDYTFNPPSRCMRTCISTNQAGEQFGPFQTDACIHPCSDKVRKEATCSQPGEALHQHICPVCASVNLEEVRPIEPSHRWVMNADGNGFVCSVCGLESEQGASGNIILEDLTEAEDSVYTIGYYVKQDVHFTPTVSVVLYDVTEGDNTVILENNGFNFTYLTIPKDGICALTFSKDAVQTAAENALAAQSYQGSYAIRITFVPLGSTANTDCAITFDSQSNVQEGE